MKTTTANNSVKLIGNLGKNPEVKVFDGGRKMARVTIATDETYEKKNGETVPVIHWHNLVAWGKLADQVEKFSKGNYVSVEGRLNNRSYTDKEGNKKHFIEVMLNDMQRVEKAA